MNAMRQDAQKLGQKFCSQKTAKMEKTHPVWAEKGETGCVLGAGEGCGRCGRVGEPEIRTNVNPTPIQHVQKENRRKPRVSAGFWQGQKDLNPRHAVLEWMWESAPGSGRGPVSPGSCRKPERGRCWFGAASYFWRRIVHRLPLLPSKEKHLPQEDGQADQDHGRVGPGSVQLRHRVEIHAVPTSN